MTTVSIGVDNSHQSAVDNIQMDANLDDSRGNILLIYSSFVCSISFVLVSCFAHLLTSYVKFFKLCVIFYFLSKLKYLLNISSN